MHAVILAGGKGTRLRPLTDTRPKPLLPFVGDPFAAGLLRRLHDAGCDRATFLVGQTGVPFAPLHDLGNALGIPVEVVTEPEPLDTAGAARDLLAGRQAGEVLVCNGDILTDLDYAGLLAAHRAAGATVTLALTRVHDTSTFGVVELDARGRVRRFVEKPPPGTVDTDTVNAGTYVLSEGAFSGCAVSGPLSFERAVFPGLVASDAVVLGVPDDAFWMDLGTPQRYLAGQAAVLTGACDWPLGDGFDRNGSVLLHRSAAVDDAAVVGECVVVGADTRVDRDAIVDGSAIFEGAAVGVGAVVRRAIVGERAVVPAGAQVIDTVIAPHATA